MRRLARLGLCAAMIVAAWSAFTTGARAAETRVTGSVVSADPDLRRLALDTDGDGAADAYFRTNSNTRIRIASTSLTPAEIDLIVGLRVTVTHLRPSGVALLIDGPAIGIAGVHATVTDVDPATRTLVIETSIGPMEFVVASGAPVRAAGGTVTLADVQSGDAIDVTYFTNATDTKVALGLELPEVRIQSVQGALASVAGGVLRVRNGRWLATLIVTRGSELFVNGRRVTLEQLATLFGLASQSRRTIAVSGWVVSRGDALQARRLHGLVR